MRGNCRARHKRLTAFVSEGGRGVRRLRCPRTLRLKLAQKPYIVCYLGPKALKYESLEP